MTQSDLVLAKMGRIRGRLQRIKDGLAGERASFLNDTGHMEQVAFNVFLAMQEAVDIASHIATDEGWGAPTTLAETFDLLARNGVLSTEAAAAMRRGTRLRNLIAHAYADIDPGRLFDSASGGLDEIDLFLAQIGRWLSLRSPPA